MEETPGERGKRIIGLLADAGRRAGLSVELEYPVVGGRVDVVWLWQGPKALRYSRQATFGTHEGYVRAWGTLQRPCSFLILIFDV